MGYVRPRRDVSKNDRRWNGEARDSEKERRKRTEWEMLLRGVAEAEKTHKGCWWTCICRDLAETERVGRVARG